MYGSMFRLWVILSRIVWYGFANFPVKDFDGSTIVACYQKQAMCFEIDKNTGELYIDVLDLTNVIMNFLKI